jgi:hypothetical protein
MQTKAKPSKIFEAMMHLPSADWLGEAWSSVLLAFPFALL